MTEAARWADFGGFVLVQAALFLALAGWRGKRTGELWAILGPSLVAGLPVGVGFDLLIGEGRGIFTYEIAPSWLFLAVNGLFSYGFAIATAALFPTVVARQRGARAWRVALLAVLAVAGIAMGACLRATTLARMFTAGWVVVWGGEALLAASGRSGPLAALLSGEARPFRRLWIWGVALGLAYEAANAAVPVWDWALDASLSRALSELFIIAFGYVVLFHPMAAAWQSLREERGDRRAADDLV
jgi:hypothetical protein